MNNLIVTSSVFQNNQLIPKKYTCQGQNVNPNLQINNIPKETKSLALIVDDPDAPKLWTHWLIWNIEPIGQINENSIPGIQGYNDCGTINYYGPCPPSETHRYFFKFYSLDSKLDLKSGANRNSLEKEINKHLLDTGQIIGLYKKQ